MQWLINQLIPLGLSICDIGAGNGSTTVKLCGVFRRVVAVEPSSAGFLALRSKVRSHSKEVYQCGAESIPLSNSAVDIALAKSSYHHFEDPKAGVREMRRIAKRAIVIVEVIAPTSMSHEFAQKLLPQKEPERPKESVYTEEHLLSAVTDVTSHCRCLHFDQYIDVQNWLKHSDLSSARQGRIIRFILNQNATVKREMHIHLRKNRLFMLRRMAVVIGLLS